MIMILIYIRNSAMNSPAPNTCACNQDVDIDTLQAAIFYLMTQYSCTRDAGCAAGVVDQISRLLEHPLIELLPVQREALGRLLNNWRMQIAESEKPLRLATRH